MKRMLERTQKNFTKTRGRFSAISITNKNPKYDYSLCRKVDIENGSDMYGWEPISKSNNDGESFGRYPGAREQANQQLIYLDTIACRRPKDVSEFFQYEEDQTYNRQVQLVQNACKQVRQAFRQLDPDSTVIDRGSSKGPGMVQRRGPTEQEEKLNG